MTPALIAIFLFVALIGLIILRVPVSFSLAFAGDTDSAAFPTGYACDALTPHDDAIRIVYSPFDPLLSPGS